MKITGKIIEIKETQQVSETFRKRNIVVEYVEDSAYPEYVTFELIKDKCDLVDGFEVGEEIEVSFNLRGRKWITPEGETRYFNSLHAWRLEALNKNNSQVSNKSTEKSVDSMERLADDDLPF